MDFRSLNALLMGGVRQLAGACGWNLYQYVDDRVVLEKVILPYIAEHPDYQRTLFVGCEWYTQHYAQMFQAKEFWTLELDPTRAKYGAARHVVDSLENISAHFTADSLDVIVCNGLLGWGLNDKPLIERTFGACVDCLRPGGMFVLGWDDIPFRRPCRPEECVALQRMSPLVLPPLATARHLTRGANRHTFDFYVKPALPPSARNTDSHAE